MGLSWAEAANYAQHAELCHIRFLSGKTRHWGPPFSHFFFVYGCFILDVFNDFAKLPFLPKHLCHCLLFEARE